MLSVGFLLFYINDSSIECIIWDVACGNVHLSRYCSGVTAGNSYYFSSVFRLSSVLFPVELFSAKTLCRLHVWQQMTERQSNNNLVNMKVHLTQESAGGDQKQS